MEDSGADARFAQLCELAAREMERLAVPGVAIGVADGDREHVAGLGVTSIDNPLPVDADTLFQIGSTSKTITATAAMRLAEQGRLSLDAPVREYLPELRLADEGVAARVTLRHLFNHTGGWAGDYFDDLGGGDDALARIVERMRDLPQLTPLGEVWSYNNAGFYVAGRVIEVVSGATFERTIDELVLAPLGMRRSLFFAGDIMTYRFAAGHLNSFEPGAPRAVVARPWPLARTAHPAGGISSTVRDQLRYARFHMGDGSAPDGTRLLSAASIAQMQTPTAPAANGEFSGISWFIKDVAGGRIVRHGGATLGQLSAFVMVPARRFAITVLTNADRGDELNRALVKLALELFPGLAEPDPAPLETPDAQLAEYAGSYESMASRLELAVESGRLRVQLTPKGGFPTKDSPPEPAPPPVLAALCGPDQLIVLDEPLAGARGEFLRDAAGRIVWLRIGGRVHARQG